MRVLALAEFEVICDACKAKLAATSEDIVTTCGGAFTGITCPVCGNTILVNNMLYKRVE